MNVDQRYVVVSIVFAVVYVLVLLFLPVDIDNASVPTIINGITTSTSIVIGLGGATMGVVLRGDIEKGDHHARKTYLYILGFFIASLLYPLWSYVFLITKDFVFAIRYSLDGYLFALLVLIIAWLHVAKRWSSDKEKTEIPDHQ